MFGLGTVALTKKQKAKLEVPELKMLRFSSSVTWMDRIRNKHIIGTAQYKTMFEKVQTCAEESEWIYW